MGIEAPKGPLSPCTMTLGVLWEFNTLYGYRIREFFVVLFASCNILCEIYPLYRGHAESEMAGVRAGGSGVGQAITTVIVHRPFYLPSYLISKTQDQ